MKKIILLLCLMMMVISCAVNSPSDSPKDNPIATTTTTIPIPETVNISNITVKQQLDYYPKAIISWDIPAKNNKVEWYMLYRSKDNVNWTLVESVNNTKNSIVDTLPSTGFGSENACWNVTYYYKLKTRTFENNYSDFSTVSNVKCNKYLYEDNSNMRFLLYNGYLYTLTRTGLFAKRNKDTYEIVSSVQMPTGYYTNISEYNGSLYVINGQTQKYSIINKDTLTYTTSGYCNYIPSNAYFGIKDNIFYFYTASTKTMCKVSITTGIGEESFTIPDIVYVSDGRIEKLNSIYSINNKIICTMVRSDGWNATAEYTPDGIAYIVGFKKYGYNDMQIILDDSNKFAYVYGEVTQNNTAFRKYSNFVGN